MSSYSFRNIFSPDDPDFEASADATVPEGFSPAGGIPLGRGSLTGETPERDPSRSFLASELLPFIPKAIAAQSGIPMAKEVKVPLPTDGSLDVPLSTLYQICPELFAAEITPLNDSVVTLPPRLGATPSGPEPSTAFSRKPALSKPPLADAASAAAASNPFWSPVTTGSQAAGGASPGSDPTVQAPAEPAPIRAQQAPAKDNPFSADPPPSKNAFAAPAAPGFQAPPKFAGGFDAPGAPAGDDAFRAAAAAFETKAATGFFGFSDPAPVKGEGGEGDLPARPNPFESNEGFSTLFSKQAEADASLPYPGKPASPDGPGRGKAAEPEGVWGAMFSGAAFGDEGIEEAGDAAAPFESIGNLLKQAASSSGPAPAAPAPVPPRADAVDSPAAFKPSSPAPASFDPFAGFASFASATPPTPPPMNPASSFAPFPSAVPPVEIPLEDSPAMSLPEAPFAMPREDEPFVMPQGFGGPPAEFSPAPAPPAAVEAPADSEPPLDAPACDTLAPAAPVAAAAPADVPVRRENPAAEPSIEAACEEGPVDPENPAPSGSDDELRDLELRAIFSASESFTFSKVARKVVGLPGISSCSLSAPGKLVQASRREENRLGNEAREMVSTLRSLAKLTGLPEARTFTLQTDRGIVSLFLEGDCCVAVHHDSATFPPGVREKLILVARSLVKLRE